MNFRLPGAATCAVAVSSALVFGLSACGSSDGADATSATDAAAGLTVTVAGDQVKLKRSAKSAAGTAGTSGTVSCTDDYAKLVKASAVPAPTQSWYATTLITWPGTSKESSARLSHALKGDPELCVVQSVDSSASAVIYFNSKVKAGVTKVQTDSSRTQQAGQASAALTAAAQSALGTVSKGAFPAATTTVVASVTAQGLYAKEAASLGAVTEAGTVYVVADKTSKSSVVLAIKDNKGIVHTATQGVKGAPKVATVKK